MEKTTKTIIGAYRLLNNARLTKMEDSEKFAVIRAMRVLKKTAADAEEYEKDARESLKDEGHADMEERARKWQEAHGGKPETELQDADRKEAGELNAYFADYMGRVAKCMEEEMEKAVTLDFAPLSDEAMGRLMASNDFTVAETMALSEVLQN